MPSVILWVVAFTTPYELAFELKARLQRRTKSTRKRNKPENAGNRPFQESAGVLRFRVLFVLL